METDACNFQHPPEAEARFFIASESRPTGGWDNSAVTIADDQVRKALLRRGFAVEYATLAWNVAGIVVLAVAAVSARSVALAGWLRP